MTPPPTRPAHTDGPRVHAYVVRSDSGFSPNPFHGWCTLACCKPALRRGARPGDLVLGLSSRCERVVYAMRVEDMHTFASYWRDARFEAKRPRWESAHEVDRRGDNIYEPVVHGGFRQHRSRHWDHVRDREHPGAKRRDLGGQFVLVAHEFVYYGGDGPELPSRLSFLHVQRGHRNRFTPQQIRLVERWFSGQPRGLRGRPTIWPVDDDPSVGEASSESRRTSPPRRSGRPCD